MTPRSWSLPCLPGRRAARRPPAAGVAAAAQAGLLPALAPTSMGLSSHGSRILTTVRDPAAGNGPRGPQAGRARRVGRPRDRVVRRELHPRRPGPWPSWSESLSLCSRGGLLTCPPHPQRLAARPAGTFREFRRRDRDSGPPPPVRISTPLKFLTLLKFLHLPYSESGEGSKGPTAEPARIMTR